jgi:hypothetical protein
MRPPTGPRARPHGLLTVLAGLLVGLVYAAALRAWMRLVSTDPEFTWTGTGFILGAFAVLGSMAGLATVARTRSGPGTTLAVRVVGIVLSLGCFIAAGAAMLPTIVPAGLGVGRTDWPHWLRLCLVGLGVAAGVAVVMTLPGLEVGRRLLALVLYAALCPVEVALVSRLYAPSRLPADSRTSVP